jgi:hypothetical protein
MCSAAYANCGPDVQLFGFHEETPVLFEFLARILTHARVHERSTTCVDKMQNCPIWGTHRDRSQVRDEN